jgi:transposase
VSQFVGDLVDDGRPRAVEVAGGGVGWRTSASALSAFRSCARQLGVDVDVVLRAANTGQLGKLIQKRSGRSAAKRNLSRIEALYRKRELAARQVTPW